MVGDGIVPDPVAQNHKKKHPRSRPRTGTMEGGRRNERKAT